MTTIVEFLLARLDETETAAKAAGWASSDAWALTDGCLITDGTGCDITINTDIRDGDSFGDHSQRIDKLVRHMVRHDPEYTLRHVEAHRRIITHMGSFFGPVEITGSGSQVAFDAIKAQYRNLLKYFAGPYAHHPDYDPAWRP